MFHEDFKNICPTAGTNALGVQTLIRVTKETTDFVTGEVKNTIQYLIANFKDKSPHEFHDMILNHWRVETFHYHKDMLTCEEEQNLKQLDVVLNCSEHICYVNPFSVSTLRSFAVNLYQLYFNQNKDKKIDNRKVTMAEIKKLSNYDDKFVADLFEA